MSSARRGLQILGVLGILVSLIWVFGFVAATANIDTQTQKYVDQQLHAGLIWGLLYIVVLGLMIPALVALTVALYGGSNRTPALLGLVLGALGISLLETVFGVLSLGSAVVAQVYKAGNTNVLDVLHKFEGGNLAGLLNGVFGAGILLALLAAVAYGIAIWRSGVLPKWTAIVFGIGFVLLASSAPFSSLPGGIIMAVACFVMARALGRRSVASDAARVRPV